MPCRTQAVAKEDKASARFLLSAVSQGLPGAVIDQWGLVLIGLAIVKNCTSILESSPPSPATPWSDRI